VAVAFTVTTITIDPSGAFAYEDAFQFLSKRGTQNEFQTHLSALPAELGLVTRSWEPGRAVAGKPFVIQIQDAHSNPEAEQNIAGILRYLEEKFPDLTIGLEGAKGRLHPEYFEFFSEFPEANRAVVDDLRQKGELNGVELYLWDKFQNRPETSDQRLVSEVSSLKSQVRVEGVEDAELYRENLKTFRDLLFRRDEIGTLLNPLRAQLEKESSKALNPDLRDFLKERERRKEGKFNMSQASGDPDLVAYIRYLKSQTLKVLQIDLTDTIEQLRFPNLIRVLLTEEAQKGFDQEAAKREWADVLDALRVSAKEKSELKFVKALETYGREQGLLPEAEGEQFSYPVERALYPRKLLEGLMLFIQKHPVDLKAYSHFMKSWKVLVLRSEVEITGLLDEMASLEENILERSAKTDTEKQFIERLNDLSLLTKLLHLELARPEYEQALDRRGDLEVLAKNIPNIKPFIAQAYQFYATSTKRDRAMLENALAFSTGTHTSHLGTRETRNQNESRVPSPKSRVIVLVTGGFHTEGLEKLLQEEGIGYAVVSPRIRGVDGGERYQKVMTGANADLGPYFKTKNPFSTKQEAILFRQLLETAAPALFEKYQNSPDQVAAHVKQAVAAHPVLSKVLSAEPLRADQDKTLRFQTRTSPLNITSQNAAVMPEALTGDSSFATFVAYGQGIEPVVTDITFGKADALTIHAVLSSSEPQTANLSDIIHVEYGQLPAARSETREEAGKNEAVTKTSEESFDRVALEKNLQKLVEMEKVQPVPKNGQASKFDELVANLLDTVGEYDPKKLSFLELKVIANNLLAEAEKDGRFDMKRIRRLLTPILGDSSDTVQDLLEQNTKQVIVEKGVLDLSTEQKKPGDPRSEMRIVGESTAEASVFAPLAVFANALPEEILYQAPKESFIGEAQKLNSIIEKTSENISRDLQKLLQKEADELKREIKIDLLLNRKTRTINLIGGLLRRLRTKGIQDPKRKPSLDHIMNQIKMYALQQLGFSGSAEEELEFAENALNDFVNDYEKRIQDLERKMEETERAAEAFAHLSLIDLKEAVKPGSFSKRAGIFNEIRKALENNAVTDPKLRDALEGTRRIYLDYAAKDSMKMMAQQTVLKPAQAYFKSEESKKETLERMKKEKKNFAAIFYEDVLSKKSAGLYDQQELYRSKGLPGMVQDWEEYISIAHRLIAELVSRHGKAKTFQIAMPEKSSGGVVLYISETMGVDKVEDIMTQFGSQIKAIVTTQANLSTHWVVALQQYPNPPPVLVISPDDENEKLFQKLSAGDEVIVSATLGEEGIQGYFLLHPGKKEIQGAIEKERGDQLMRIAEKGSAHIKDSNLNFFANTFVGETQSVIESKAEGIGLTRSEVDKAITKMVEDIATTLALEIKSTQALQRAVQSLLEYLERAYHFESSDTSTVIKLLMDAIRELAKISSVPRNRRAAVKKIILSVQKKLEKYYNLKKVETSQNDDWLVDFVLNFFDSKDHPELFNSNIATFGSYLEKLYSIEPVNHLEVDPSLVELHNTIGRSTAILSRVPDRLKKSLDLFRLHLEQSYFAQLDNPSLVDKDQVFRTLDLWPDKNTDLFDVLFKVFGYAAEDWNAFTEEYSGFNFYRTPLGKEILTQQVAALIIVQEQLLKSRQGQTPRLKLMFPQIDGLADIEFISNEILEQAEVVASQVLKERGTQEPKEMVSQIVETISYGAMVETPQAVQELEKILNFQRHGKPFVKFISVGTNDLEMKLLEKFLLEQTGVSVHANRDYAWAQPWIERLDPNNVELYLKIASTIADLNLRTGRNVGLSFCGEVASHDKFILFSKFLKKRFGNHLTLTLSMSPNKIAHAKLVSRHIDSSFDFSFLEHLVGDADQRASKKASDAFRKVSSILVVLEEWQSRYQKAGFDNAFYRLNIDPVKGEGSFEEFNFLKRLIVKLLWQDESEELRALRERLALDPKDEMTRDELERIIRHYRIKDFIGQKDQELLESREEDLLLLRRFDFLKSIRDVFREYQKDKKLKQNILHPSFVNDFLKFYRRHYELLGQTVEWLPTDDEKTFQAFFKEYREATTSVFDDIVLMSRRLLLNQFPPKYTPYDLGERVQRAGFASDQIELVTTEGFTFRRNVGWGYGRDHELHIKNAVELFTGRPELIFDVFALTVLYGVRISEKTQQAILQTKQQLDLLMERIRSGDPEVKDESTHLKNVFQEIFQSKNPASYALWRMHGLDVMDIFIPTYKTMRAFFEAGQRYSVDLQTMRALEILDTLEGKGNFFFLIPKQVMHEVAEHESMILTLRYAIFMDGIVRARIGSGASERSIRELVKETLYPVGIDSKTLDDIVWLLMSQREISKRDLLSQEQIDSLWGRFSANPGLTKERWTLLYLMTFSIRASLAEPEKMPLLIRLGQQSPLLYITQLFTQGYVMQRSMQTPNALDSLDLFRTLHEKRLDEVAWKWLEHRNSGELFEKYLEQTSQGNIPDLKTQIAKMLGIQEKKQDEKIFTSIFEKCIRLISYSYIRALDIQEIVTTLVFYIHLQLLKENKVADTVLTLFRKLPDNAREGYEILMGYPEYKPELVPIFSRVLYENGFILEEAVPHFGDEGAVIRFMGYFRHERGDELAVETKVKKIQEDLQKIYHSQGSGRTDFFASLFGVRHRPFDNTKRLYGNKLKLHKDYENWQGVETVVRFLSPSELFEDIPFKQEKIGRHSDVLIVETSDREGLLAAISTILYEKGDGVGIKDFIFDDVKATSPRGIFLVDKDGNALDKELKEKLSAYLEKKLAEHSDKPEAAPSRLARVLTSPGETGLIVVEETQSGAESVLSAPDATAEESEDVVIGEKTEEAPSVEAAEEEKIILETFYEIRGTSLHARPATILVKLAERYSGLSPRLKTKDQDVSMNSIMQLLMTESVRGSGVSIYVSIPKDSETGEKEAKEFFRTLNLEKNDSGYLFGDEELGSGDDKGFLKFIKEVRRSELRDGEKLSLEQVIVAGKVDGIAQVDSRKTLLFTAGSAQSPKTFQSDFNNVFDVSKNQIEALRERWILLVKSDQTSIVFESHVLLLSAIKEAVVPNLEKNMDLKQALLETGKKFSEMFQKTAIADLQDKAIDVVDITFRLLRNLSGEKTESHAYQDKIVVTKTLYPSDFPERYLGAKAIVVVSPDGKIENHNRALAKNLGVPLVTISEESFGRIIGGAELSLDTDAKELAVIRSESRASQGGLRAGIARLVRSIKIIFWTELALLPPTLWAYPYLLESFKQRLADMSPKEDPPAEVSQVGNNFRSAPEYFEVASPASPKAQTPAVAKGSKDIEHSLRQVLSSMDNDQNYRIFKNLFGYDPSISIEKKIEFLSNITPEDLLQQFSKKSGVPKGTFIQAARENDIPLEMLLTVILRETSNFDAQAISPNKGRDSYPDIGICQINLKTAFSKNFLDEALRRNLFRTSKKGFNLYSKKDRDEMTRLLLDPEINIRYEALIFSGHSAEVTRKIQELVEDFGAEGFLGLGAQFARSPEWVKFLFAANNIGPTGVVKKVQARLASGGKTNAFNQFFPEARYVPPAANYYRLMRILNRNNPAQFAYHSQMRGEMRAGAEKSNILRSETRLSETHQNDPEQLLAKVYTDQSRRWGTTDFTPILPSRYFPEDINHSGFPDNYQEREKFYQIVSSMLERVEDKTAPKDKTANKDRTVLVDFLVDPEGYVDIVVAAANEHEIVFGEAVQKAIGEAIESMQPSDQAPLVVSHPYLHSNYRNSKGAKVYASLFTLEFKTLKALSEKEQQRIRRAIWDAVQQKRQQEEYKRKNHGREELMPVKDDPEARAREDLNRRLLVEENRKESIRNLVAKSLAGLPSEHMAASTVGEDRLWRLTDDLSELVKKSAQEKGDPQSKIYNVSDIVPGISSVADHTELLIAVKSAPDTEQIVDAWLKEQGIEILRQYSRMIRYAHSGDRRPKIPNIQYVYLEIRSNGKALEKEAGNDLVEKARQVLRAEVRTLDEIKEGFLEEAQKEETFYDDGLAGVLRILQGPSESILTQETFDQLLALLPQTDSWAIRTRIVEMLHFIAERNPEELGDVEEKIAKALNEVFAREKAKQAEQSDMMKGFLFSAMGVSSAVSEGLQRIQKERFEKHPRSEMRNVVEEVAQKILGLEPNFKGYPSDRSPELGNADQSIMKNRSLIHEIADYIMHPNDKTSRIYKLMEKSGVQDDRGMQYEILAKAQDLLHQEVETFDFKRILTAISTMQDVYRKENVVKGKAQVLGVLVELEIDLGQAGAKNPMVVKEKNPQNSQKALELSFMGTEKLVIERALSEKLNRSEAREEPSEKDHTQVATNVIAAMIRDSFLTNESSLLHLARIPDLKADIFYGKFEDQIEKVIAEYLNGDSMMFSQEAEEFLKMAKERSAAYERQAREFFRKIGFFSATDTTDIIKLKPAGTLAELQNQRKILAIKKGFGGAWLGLAVFITSVVTASVHDVTLSLLLGLPPFVFWLIYQAIQARAEKKAYQKIEDENYRLKDEVERSIRIREQTATSIIIMDSHGNIEYVNPAFTMLTGYEFGQVKGNHVSILKPNSNDRNFYRNLWATVARSGEWKGELYHKKKDGNIYLASVTIAEIRDEETRLVGYVMEEQDITARKELEERLKKELQELEKTQRDLAEARKSAAVARLAEGMAHNFQNRLAQMQGQLDEVKKASTKQQRLDEKEIAALTITIDHIADEIRKTSGIVDDILRFSQPLSDSAEILDIHSVIQTVIEQRKLHERQGIRIVENYSAEPLWVRSDRTSLERAFSEILLNAEQATEKGGTISISTRKIDARRFSVTIQDTGKGIEEKDKTEVFHAFWTTEPAKRRGLGLWIAGTIATRHGGKIHLTSKPGEGTSVETVLPIPPPVMASDIVARQALKLQTEIFAQALHKFRNAVTGGMGYALMIEGFEDLGNEFNERFFSEPGSSKGIRSLGIIKKIDKLHRDLVKNVEKGDLPALKELVRQIEAELVAASKYMKDFIPRFKERAGLYEVKSDDIRLMEGAFDSAFKLIVLLENYGLVMDLHGPSSSGLGMTEVWISKEVEEIVELFKITNWYVHHSGEKKDFAIETDQIDKNLEIITDIYALRCFVWSVLRYGLDIPGWIAQDVQSLIDRLPSDHEAQKSLGEVYRILRTTNPDIREAVQDLDHARSLLDAKPAPADQDVLTQDVQRIREKLAIFLVTQRKATFFSSMENGKAVLKVATTYAGLSKKDLEKKLTPNGNEIENIFYLSETPEPLSASYELLRQLGGKLSISPETVSPGKKEALFIAALPTRENQPKQSLDYEIAQPQAQVAVSKKAKISLSKEVLSGAVVRKIERWMVVDDEEMNRGLFGNIFAHVLEHERPKKLTQEEFESFRKTIGLDGIDTTGVEAVVDSVDLSRYVLLVPSAVKAVQIVKKNPGIVDGYSMDFTMPEKNGDEGAREIREITRQNGHDPIIMMVTGYGSGFANVVKLQEEGTIDYALGKPLPGIEEIRAKVEELKKIPLRQLDGTPRRSEMRKASQAEINKMIEGLGLQEAAELSPFVFAWKKRLFADVHPGNGAAHEAELSNMKLDLDRQKALPWQDFKRYLIAQAQELEEAGFSGITDRIEVEIRAALKNAKEDPRIAGIKNDGEKAKQIVIRAKTILSGQFQRSVWYQYARESQNAKAGKIFGKDDLLIRDMPTVAQIPFIVLTSDQQIHWEVLKFFQNKDYFDPTLWDFPQDYYYDNTTHFTIEELAAKFTFDPKTKKLIPRLKQATFDLGTKETEPADRSEMRAFEKTGEPLKPTQTFKGELLDAPSAAPLPVDPEILRTIDVTAAELANIYSENGTGFYAKELSPTQIRAWIADQLLRPIRVMVREQLGSISNEKLAPILQNLKQFALSGQIDESNKFISGPEFHVNITDLLPGQWDILKSHLTFILDAIVVFNGKIVISMDGDEKAAQEKEAELRELARADGVELGKDQLKIVSVRDSKSFPLLTEGKPADAIMARKEEKLGPRNHARARSYWVTDDANDMKALSASILTALLYSLSDKNAFNPGTQHSNGHKTLLEAALNAIQGYQQIRTAA